MLSMSKHSVSIFNNDTKECTPFHSNHGGFTFGSTVQKSIDVPKGNFCSLVAKVKLPRCLDDSLLIHQVKSSKDLVDFSREENLRRKSHMNLDTESNLYCSQGNPPINLLISNIKKPSDLIPGDEEMLINLSIEDEKENIIESYVSQNFISPKNLGHSLSGSEAKISDSPGILLLNYSLDQTEKKTYWDSKDREEKKSYSNSPINSSLRKIDSSSAIDTPKGEDSCSSDMNSSTDSVNNLDMTRDHRQFPKPFQGGKRCGVIFVTSEEDIQGNSLFSFIVVKGKTSNIYSFPKGRVSSETEGEEECALREVYEETGIFLHEISNLPRIVLGRNIYFVYHTTKYEFTKFTIHDTFEVGYVGWKNTKELSTLICNKDLRAVLRYPFQKHSFHRIIFRENYRKLIDPLCDDKKIEIVENKKIVNRPLLSDTIKNTVVRKTIINIDPEIKKSFRFQNRDKMFKTEDKRNLQDIRNFSEVNRFFLIDEKKRSPREKLPEHKSMRDTFFTEEKFKEKLRFKELHTPVTFSREHEIAFHLVA